MDLQENPTRIDTNTDQILHQTENEYIYMVEYYLAVKKKNWKRMSWVD